MSIPKGEWYEGSWYDTGIWVIPGKVVRAATWDTPDIVPQPFVLAVDNTTMYSKLNQQNLFNATVFVTDQSKNKTGDNVALVENQGKIYLKVPSEASTNYVSIVLSIEYDTPSENTDASTLQENVPVTKTSRNGWGLFGWKTLSIIGGVVYLILVLILSGVDPYIKFLQRLDESIGKTKLMMVLCNTIFYIPLFFLFLPGLIYDWRSR